MNNNLLTYIEKRAEYSEGLMVMFGLFGLINYPAFYIYFHYFIGAPNDDFTIRLIATIFCLTLVLKNHWPTCMKKYVPFYWFFTVLFCIPFFSTYQFIASQFSPEWTVNIILGLFWLILILDWASFAIILPLGICLAILLYKFSHSTFPHLQPHLFSEISSNIGWTLLTSLFFSRKKEIMVNQKFETLVTFSASIAHELRTPLRTIASISTYLQRLLPKVLTGYQKAKQAKLDVPTLTKDEQVLLAYTAHELDEEIYEASHVIDMLLNNVNLSTDNNLPISVCLVNYCIKEALKRYAFDHNQKHLIRWKQSNHFEFNGNETLVIHILFNLLKNSFWAIKAVGHGDITIWTELHEAHNELHFKDTGQGIDKKDLPHIFEQFYTKTKHGTGIGLSFSQLAMKRMNGQIVCYSTQGKFSEFILKFPKIKPKNNINKSN